MGDGVYGNDGPHFTDNFVEEMSQHAEKWGGKDLKKKKSLY